MIISGMGFKHQGSKHTENYRCGNACGNRPQHSRKNAEKTVAGSALPGSFHQSIAKAADRQGSPRPGKINQRRINTKYGQHTAGDYQNTESMGRGKISHIHQQQTDNADKTAYNKSPQ